MKNGLIILLSYRSGMSNSKQCAGRTLSSKKQKVVCGPMIENLLFPFWVSETMFVKYICKIYEKVYKFNKYYKIYDRYFLKSIELIIIFNHKRSMRATLNNQWGYISLTCLL